MEFVLDCKIWRCGNLGRRRDSYLGMGPSILLNNKGYQCCVGQFAQQCGVSQAMIAEKGGLESPTQFIGTNIDILYQKVPDLHAASLGSEEMCELHSTLYEVNDDTEYDGDSPCPIVRTITEKIEEIRKRLALAGHTLKVINEDCIPVNACAANTGS